MSIRLHMSLVENASNVREHWRGVDKQADTLRLYNVALVCVRGHVTVHDTTVYSTAVLMCATVK